MKVKEEEEVCVVDNVNKAPYPYIFITMFDVYVRSKSKNILLYHYSIVAIVVLLIGLLSTNDKLKVNDYLLISAAHISSKHRAGSQVLTYINDQPKKIVGRNVHCRFCKRGEGSMWH